MKNECRRVLLYIFGKIEQAGDDKISVEDVIQQYNRYTGKNLTYTFGTLGYRDWSKNPIYSPIWLDQNFQDDFADLFTVKNMNGKLVLLINQSHIRIKADITYLDLKIRGKIFIIYGLIWFKNTRVY